MDIKDRVKLLGSIELFAKRDEKRLRELAERLEPHRFQDGVQIFAEGTEGDGLYFVVSGRVRIAKRLPSGGEKDLAVLGPGDCFGEMALLERAPRSAGAYAGGATTLLRLSRVELKAWLSVDPAPAVEFFSGLVQIQSGRLRRTSAELALLYDLSALLLEGAESPVELLRRALERIVPHLPGEWSGCAMAYNPFNREMDPAGSLGPEPFGPEAAAVPKHPDPASRWEKDGRTLALILRSPTRLLGTLRLRSKDPLDDDARAENGHVLNAAAGLLASALENAAFRLDESLRRRLKDQNYGQGL